jgi:hypothetical protein
MLSNMPRNNVRMSVPEFCVSKRVFTELQPVSFLKHLTKEGSNEK